MTILKKVETWAAAGAVLGLAFAAVGHGNMIEARDAMAATGKVYTAEIDGGQIKTKRGSSSVTLNLSWVDAQGKQQAARQVGILSDLSNRIIKDKTLTVDTIEIKVLDGESKPFIVEELPIRAKDGEGTRNFFGMAGCLSAIVWLGLFFAGRGRRDSNAGATANA